MDQVLFIENRWYTSMQIMDGLGVAQETFDLFSTELKQKKLFVTNTNESRLHKFNFVGVIAWRMKTFIVLPKIYRSGIAKSDRIIIVQAVQRSIVKYLQSINSSTALEMGIASDAQSLLQTLHLGTIIALLEDFSVNPELDVRTQISETDGDGEIHWPMTIQRSLPWIVDTRVRYLDLVTVRADVDRDSLLRRVYRSVLQQCDEELQGLGLEGMFAEPSRIEDAEVLSDLLDYYDVISFLEEALSKTYREDLALRIRLIIRFIDELIESEFESELNLVVLGAREFHVVWEAVCSYTLGNQFGTANILRSPDGRGPVSFSAQEHFVFGEDESFRWGKGVDVDVSGRPLKPDLIISGSIDSRSSDSAEVDKYLWVLDAKYYDVEAEAWPIFGIEDVVKQCMYQVAIERRVDCEEEFLRGNFFLYPTVNSDFKMFGSISFDMLEKLSPTDILTVGLPFIIVLQMYSNGARSCLRSDFLDFVLCQS